MLEKQRQTNFSHIIQVSLALIFASIISSPSLAQNTPLPAIDAFGPAFGTAQLAPKTQTRVYAYRAPNASQSQPINIYLDGRYHSSLLRNGYTEFCLNPGLVRVQSALDDAQQLYQGKEQTGQALNTQAGQVLFLRVTEGAGNRASVETVSEQEALPELRRTARQQHTISRAPAVQACSTALSEAAKPIVPAIAPVVITNPPPKAAPAREYALETDALFEFGKAELKAEGFNSIEVLIQKVRKEYNHIDRIRVIGYTDAIGPVKLNKKLSQQRADAIAKRLQTRGLKPSNGIQAEGRWSLELAKTDCKDSPTPANKACHAPNRRVVIVIYGLRR